MNFKKFLIGIAILTSSALFYVHQEVELLKVGYELRRHEKAQSELLDQNSSLSYNILALKSPSRLEAVLSSKGGEYRMPERWNVIALNVERREREWIAAPEKRRGFFAELFSVKREAQARAIR